MNPRGFLIALMTVSVIVGCGAATPPSSFMRTFDEPGTWKSIEVREGMEKEQIWQVLVDGLTQKFDLEVLDKNSGYARTSWKYTYIVDGKVNERYRSRIIVKMMGEGWKTLQVKSEANWMDKNGWALGYDTRLLEDTYGDLQGRMGRVRR